jgi:hypothetical protein
MKTEFGTYTSRKIEAAMCHAAANMYAWKSGNTEVTIGLNGATNTPCARVWLHGNHIATVTRVRHDTTNLQVWRDVLIRWPIKTTISRLRALGADVVVKKTVVYLDGQKL